MEIENITNDVILIPSKIDYIFKDLLTLIESTKYNRATLSITDSINKVGFILNKNENWVNKYINEKLYLKDPVCEWENKVNFDISKSYKKNKIYHNNFEDIHNNSIIDGSYLKKIRNNFKINSGGVVISKISHLVITTDFWSSFESVNFEADFCCLNKRQFFLDIRDILINIYEKNYHNIFKDKKIIYIENDIIDLN